MISIDYRQMYRAVIADNLSPGGDAMTVAITQEHNEARLAGTLAFLDRGQQLRAPAHLRRRAAAQSGGDAHE